jgi:hypothetical protein
MTSTLVHRRRMALVTTPLVGGAMAVIVAMTGSGIAHADTTDTVTATEAASALEDASRLSSSAAAEATVSGDEVTTDANDDAGVAIPTDAEDGVELGVGESALTVNLPYSDDAGRARVVNDGTIAYPSNDGVANAVQVDNAGAVSFSTVIAGPDSPSVYPYEFDLPEGASFQPQDDGSILVISSDEAVLQAIGAPTAKDANGVAVSTWYDVNGDELVQHVDHNEDSVAYPVVADPFVIPAYMVWKIIRCGGGAWLGWISSGGWAWYGRALAVVGGCITAW